MYWDLSQKAGELYSQFPCGKYVTSAAPWQTSALPTLHTPRHKNIHTCCHSHTRVRASHTSHIRSDNCIAQNVAARTYYIDYLPFLMWSAAVWMSLCACFVNFEMSRSTRLIRPGQLILFLSFQNLPYKWRWRKLPKVIILGSWKIISAGKKAASKTKTQLRITWEPAWSSNCCSDNFQHVIHECPFRFDYRLKFSAEGKKNLYIGGPYMKSTLLIVVWVFPEIHSQ